MCFTIYLPNYGVLYEKFFFLCKHLFTWENSPQRGGGGGTHREYWLVGLAYNAPKGKKEFVLFPPCNDGVLIP